MFKTVVKDANKYGIVFSEEEIKLFSLYFKKNILTKNFRSQFDDNDLIGPSLILNGIIRLYSIKNGQDYTIQYFTPGQWIGLESMIVQEKSLDLKIEPIKRTEILTIRVSCLEEFTSLSRSFDNYLRSVAIKQYFEFMYEKARFQQFTSEEQYLDFVAKYPEIVTLVPLKQIANYLNIQPGSLSRIRKRLSQK